MPKDQRRTKPKQDDQHYGFAHHRTLDPAQGLTIQTRSSRTRQTLPGGPRRSGRRLSLPMQTRRLAAFDNTGGSEDDHDDDYVPPDNRAGNEEQSSSESTDSSDAGEHSNVAQRVGNGEGSSNVSGDGRIRDSEAHTKPPDQAAKIDSPSDASSNRDSGSFRRFCQTSGQDKEDCSLGG